MFNLKPTFLMLKYQWHNNNNLKAQKIISLKFTFDLEQGKNIFLQDRNRMFILDRV